MSESMEEIREEVERQVGVRESVESEYDPATLVHFADNLTGPLDPAERERLIARARELAPWLQGPFLLGDDLVVGGLWRIDTRWAHLGEQLPDDLGGIRVLDVGSNAGYDPFMFKRRGAGEVIACEPFEFIEQAHFLESIYKSGVNFQRIGWQELSHEEYGSFELVHCHGVLYHEVDPMGLLTRLFEMTAPGGTLLLGSMMFGEAERSGLSRFVPRAYFRDHTWWWVPGPEALKAMIGAAGFEVEGSFGESGGPAGEFPTINGYFRARRPA
jgi:SAM-dependent methyltransferase